MSFLAYEFLHNTVRNWLVAGVLTLLVFLLLFAFRALLRQYLARLVKHAFPDWEKTVELLLRQTHWILLFGIALLAGSQVLNLADNLRKLLSSFVIVTLIIQAGVWAGSVIRFLAVRYQERRCKEDPASITTVQAITFLTRILIWGVVILLILANLGIEITPLLAGLGVGGIAVALAVQAILKDLLASLSIMLDKPFVVGDFLILGDLMGRVEHIGIKTTRIRSLSGEQLIFSNNDLLESRIRNFGRMRERRAVFTIGVTYQTPHDKLTRIPGIIRAAVEAQPQTRFDRCHFKEYGSFSLNFETVFFMGVPDMNVYLDKQQAINLRIYQEFQKEGIEFAYPTQTLFIANPQPAPRQPQPLS